MRTEEETVLMIRGAIAGLDEEELGKVKRAYAALLKLQEDYGDAAAIMAIALRGAELQA